ncbi:hypothetical protein V502_01182, partial [Pseudogymnoascus sp. VKM F-4520 (FW-2644)]
MAGATGVCKPPTPQLSCELCRERKVKCDKLEPCTTCVSAGVECIPIFRRRLPRGRHAQKSSNVTQQQKRLTQQHEDREAQVPTERRTAQPNPSGRTLQSDGHDETINAQKKQVVDAFDLPASRPPRSQLGTIINDEYSQTNAAFPDLDTAFADADHMLWTDSNMHPADMQDSAKIGNNFPAHSQNPSRNTTSGFENTGTSNGQSPQP